MADQVAMSDLAGRVVQEQPTNGSAVATPGETSTQPEEQQNSATANGPGGPSLIGLGPLRSNKHITLRQRIRCSDIIGSCTGCEVEKKYTIHGGSNDLILTAKETSNLCMRCWCGSAREMKVAILDTTNREVLHLDRPLNCIGCCCSFMYPHCTQSVTVTREGRLLGIIRERATWVYPVFHIFDEQDQPIMKVRGPCCHANLCGDVTFTVTDTAGRHAAQIKRRWLGFCKGALLDADNFDIEFHDSVETDDRCRILATAFLIDLMYYEMDSAGNIAYTV